MFFYANTVSGNDVLYDSRAATGNPTDGFSIVRNSDQLRTYTSGAYKITPSTFRVATNRWYHLAITRESTTQKMYIDGELVGSATVSNDFSQNKATIGSDVGTGEGWDGFISNVRLIKGTALYTANFTPPSAPLTDVTNTKLLCCQSNTLAGSAAVTPVTGNTGYTGTSQSITLNQANLNAGTVANVVDGSTSTSADIRDAGSFVELIFPQQQNGELQVNVSNGNDVGDDNIRVFIDGVEGTAFDVSSQSWHTIHTGNFTTVKLEQQGSTTGNIFGFRIGTGGDTIISKSLAPVGDAAATNFNPFNTDINTVRGQETGYPTWNPLTKSTSTLSNGNLTITTDGGSGYPIELVNTFTPVGRGQWYWEFTLSALSGSNYTLVGMLPSDSPYEQGNSNHFAEAAVRGFYVYVGYDGSVSAYSGAATAGSATATAGVGDVVGWAYDAENGTLKCFINGIPQGTQFTNIRTDVGWLFGVTDYDNSATASYTINFGQKPFKFPPPAGFQPLNTANVRPETVITRPDQYVGVTTYTGNGGTQSIETGHKFDFVWIKTRSGSGNHHIFDVVRGVNKSLHSDTTASTETTTAGLTSFDSNGFSIGNSNNDINGNDITFVSWNWKAGGSKNTFNVDDVGYASAAAAGLTAGDTTPTGASVGTKQGFSIIKYTGPNDTNNHEVPHGLSQAPDFIITKNLDATYNWDIYHSSLADDAYLIFTNAATRAQGFNGRPTSTVFKTEHDYSTNENQDYIAYCWHNVTGLQKFGKYIWKCNMQIMDPS